MKGSKSKLLLVGASFGALVASAPARAQNTSAAPGADSNSGIQEIIVTAQRRTESVQKASISISVLSAEAIANAGVTQAANLSNAVAGLQIGQAGAATQIYIRGVGDFGSTGNGSPAVSFNVDGVYISRPTGIEGHFYDLERVEVLKGPQGTLYGRNSPGGAINIITSKPKLGVRSLAGAIEIGNYSKLGGEVAVNLPIGDDFAIRAAAQIISREPYVTMNFNDEVRQSARLQALWQPSDDVSLRLEGDYTHIGGGGEGNVGLNRLPGVSPWTSVTDPAYQNFYNGRAAASGLCVPPAPFGPPIAAFAGGCPNVPAAAFPPTPPGQYNQLVTGNFGKTGLTNTEIWGISGQLDYNLGFATLTILPAYRKIAIDYVTYPGFTISFDPSANGIPETSQTTTVEARLAHDSDRLKWVVGGFFYNEDQRSYAYVSSGPIQLNLVGTRSRTRSYAGFGQASFSVTDSFRLIAGGRYTSDNRSTLSRNFQIQGSLGFLALAGATGGACVKPVLASEIGPGFIGCAQTPTAGDRTFTKFNFKGGLELDLSPQNMIYATVSTGYKAGGFYPAQAAAVPGVAGSFNPENITAYEFGSRNRFLDNRLQINAEGFYYNYRDHQEPVIILDGAGNVAQSFQNVGSGRVYGTNLDLVFKASKHDTFHFGVEYLDSKYTQFALVSPIVTTSTLFFPAGSTGCPVVSTLNAAGIAAGATIPTAPGQQAGVSAPNTPLPGLTRNQVIGSQVASCAGKPFTRSPKFSGVASYSHVFELGEGNEIEIEGNMQFQSSRYLATDYLPISLAGAYQVYNASLTYRAPGNSWSLTGFVRNISNEAVYTSAATSAFLTGVSSASINPPRTYGARLNFKF